MTDIQKTISLKGLDQIVSEFNKLKNELDGVKAKYKELKEETKHSKQESAEHRTELENWAAGYLSVGAAIAVTTAGAHAFLQEQERIGAQFDKNNESLTRQLLLTGQLKAGKQAEEFIRSTGGDFEKGVAAFTGVAMGAGGKIDATARETIARDIMKVSPLLEAGDVSDLSKFAGSLEKMGFAPERAGGAAILARQMAGQEAQSLMSRKSRQSMKSMVDMGFSSEEALAFGVAAASEDLGPKFADSLLEAISSTEQPGFTATANKRRFLNEKNGRSRLEMLKSNPAMAKELLGEKKALEFARQFNAIPSIAENIAANAGTAADAMVSDARSFDAGQEAWSNATKKGIDDKADRDTARANDPYADAWQNISSTIDKQYNQSTLFGTPFSYVGSMIAKAVYGLELGADQFLGQSPEGTLKHFERNANFSPEIMKAFRDKIEADKASLRDANMRDRAATVPSRSVHGE